MPYSKLFFFVILIQLITGEESWTFSNDDASHDPNDVSFYLYSDPNNYSIEAGVLLDLNNLTSLKNAPVKIIIHGFQKNYTCWIPQEIKDTYFQQGIKTNIIAVDWNKLAEPITRTIKILPHPDHLNNAKITGKRIAQLIFYLVRYRNVSLSQIHIIAHSLGALVAGEAGVEVENLLGRKVGRISALDPAGPGYFPGTSGRLLLDTDAKFVDVIHVAVLDEGRTGPVGDVDFYMNKAGYAPQPGCEGNPICSHESAGSYWIQSIGHPEICACRRMKPCKCQPEGNGMPFGENALPKPMKIPILKILKRSCDVSWRKCSPIGCLKSCSHDFKQPIGEHLRQLTSQLRLRIFNIRIFMGMENFRNEGAFFLRMAPVELSGKYEC